MKKSIVCIVVPPKSNALAKTDAVINAGIVLTVIVPIGGKAKRLIDTIGFDYG